MITMKLTGFNEGIADLREHKRLFKQVASKELQRWAQEGVDRLKKNVLADKVMPHKMEPNGQPTLVDEGLYINSFVVVEPKPMQVQIVMEGDNTYLSNMSLGEMLEDGTKRMPPRPHIRPVVRWMMRRLDLLGERIRDGVLWKS